MRKETMTPRERWLAALKGQKQDRVPMDYPIRGGGSEPFLTYKNLRGEERSKVSLGDGYREQHFP